VQGAYIMVGSPNGRTQQPFAGHVTVFDTAKAPPRLQPLARNGAVNQSVPRNVAVPMSSS